MDKEKIFSDTLKALENYLRKEDRVYWGMLSGKVKGAISRILTEDRYYFVRYTVDDDMERFYVSIYPQIIAEKHYLRMLHAYVNSKTSDYKSGRVDVDNSTGEVKIVAESSIVSHPITESEIVRPESDVHDFYRNVCAAIDGKAEQIVTHAQLLRVMKIMEAAFRSDAIGAPVEIDDEIC